MLHYIKKIQDSLRQTIFRTSSDGKRVENESSSGTLVTSGARCAARSTKFFPPGSLLVSPMLAKNADAIAIRRNDATNRHERLTCSLAYIRKGGPLLMRACRCVSERRSRASAEVIGQYQSQPRDNHSCHASRGCVRECVFARIHVYVLPQARACVIVAKLIISRAARCRRAYPVGLCDFQGEREGQTYNGIIGFAVPICRRRFLTRERECLFWLREISRKFKA